MDDLIGRQDAIEEFYGVKFDEGYCTEYEIGYNDGIDFAVDRLSVLPSAQPERKKGRWIYGEDEYGIDGYCCDKCGFFAPWYHIHNLLNYTGNYNFWNFCPCCGADMRERKEE